MPTLEERSILDYALELIHLNFRDIRTKIEFEMVHLRNIIATGSDLDEACRRIIILKKQVQRTKHQHVTLVKKLEARVNYWIQHEYLPSNDSTKSLDTIASDEAFIVPIANFLAENELWHPYELLLDARPDIRNLVDEEAYRETSELLAAKSEMNYSKILAWCRLHRSSLKKVNSNLEFQAQLARYVFMLKEGNFKEALAFGKKAFSSVNTWDSKQIIEATGWLYRNNRLFNDPFDIGKEIKRAVRQVYHIPSRNPMLTRIFVGAAAVKTVDCIAGKLADEAQNPKNKTICPLCRSLYMEELLDFVPPAQHSHSNLPHDLMRFPSGAVTSLELMNKNKCSDGRWLSPDGLYAYNGDFYQVYAP